MSINIEKCLEYYLQRHFVPARRLRTAAFGECPYADLLRRGSEFDADPSEKDSDSKGLLDLVYLGGGHDFLELTAAVKSAQTLLVPGGILVLPHLDVPTTHFVYRYLKAEDSFSVHFTMENTAFMAYAPRSAAPDLEWTAAHLNRQQFPAFDYLEFAVLPTAPVLWSYQGHAAACGGELERGFLARSGRILSEGHWSRIVFKLAQPPATPVEVAVEVRGCARCLPRQLTVSLALAGAPADVQVLTGDNVVTLRATGALAAEGVVSLDLTFSDVFLASDVAEAGFDLPPFGRLAVELLSVSVTVATDSAPPGRTIRHHDGRVASVFHDGQEFRFFVDNPHDSIQAHHFVGEFYEMDELRLLSRHVGPGARILDVGANIGNHAVYFERVMRASRVVVIELQDRVIALLRLNALLNGLVRTDLSRLGIGFGASDHGAGIVIPQAFNLAGAQFHAEETGAYVIRRGDDVLDGEDFDLIKIDVEGMECDVIEGLEATIRRSQPKLFVEVWQDNLPRFYDQMARLGYRKVDEWRRYDFAVNLLMEANHAG